MSSSDRTRGVGAPRRGARRALYSPSPTRLTDSGSVTNRRARLAASGHAVRHRSLSPNRVRGFLGASVLERRSRPPCRRPVGQAGPRDRLRLPPVAVARVALRPSRACAALAAGSRDRAAERWRRWRLQPWRAETFKFSTDPQLEAKVPDVVALYLNSPDKAIVLCVDEKSQVQALDRAAPTLPMRLGLPEKQTHDYIRHGTTTLFAALEIATGRVEQACLPRHRHQEFLAL